MSRSFAWNEPQRLVQSLGGKWDFQHSLDLGNLSSSICRHYHAWKDGTADPQSHPLFVCISGCGTGKSRLLDEFPKLVKESEEHMDQEMKQLLQNAYTFKITFDNETKDNGGITDPKKMLGTRMLYQLQNAVDWSVFSANPDNHVVPEEVLMKLSNITGRDLSQMCVILCVDSLHKVPHEPGHKDSQFTTAFGSVCELINASKCFVIAICSSSCSQPVDESLANSPQWSMKLETISLQYPTINGKSVF